MKSNEGFEESIEIEGKTVKEAIKKALKLFKVPREYLKIEVLREEEKGLFNMPGAKSARIKVEIIKKNKKILDNNCRL